MCNPANRSLVSSSISGFPCFPSDRGGSMVGSNLAKGLSSFASSRVLRIHSVNDVVSRPCARDISLFHTLVDIFRENASNLFSFFLVAKQAALLVPT